MLGAIALLGYIAMAALSYVQAAALWRTVPAPRAQAFFDAMAEWLRPASPWLSGWFAAGQWLSDNVGVIALYCAVLAIPTLAYIALITLVAGNRDASSDAMAGVLKRWAYAFTAACFLAHPVFTQDFWLSALWGRMIASGQNPFHELFADADIGALPLDHFPMPMSYGPLWGLVSAAIMLVSGGNLLLTAILFKLTLAVAWCGSIACVDRICETVSPRRRALSIAVLGWAPAGVSQAVAEGHNDVVMVALSLLWLALLVRRRWQAPLALAASALCKYVSLPLAAVELLVLLLWERNIRRRILRILLPALAGSAVMAIFFRSFSFFDGLLIINDWHFLRPRDAVEGLEGIIGLPLDYVGIAATFAFPAIAVRQFLIAYREPSFDSMITLAVALMAGVLFGGIAHVWPWYLIWGLGLAALKPSWWVSRFVIGVSIASPFTLAGWWIAGLEDQRDLICLVMYAFAILWAAYPAVRRAKDGASIFKRAVDAESRV